jgi:hypothetical protein
MLLYRLELGPPTSRFFSFHWTAEAIKYEGITDMRIKYKLGKGT